MAPEDSLTLIKSTVTRAIRLSHPGAGNPSPNDLLPGKIYLTSTPRWGEGVKGGLGGVAVTERCPIWLGVEVSRERQFGQRKTCSDLCQSFITMNMSYGHRSVLRQAAG